MGKMSSSPTSPGPTFFMYCDFDPLSPGGLPLIEKLEASDVSTES